MTKRILSKITLVDMSEGAAGPYAATVLGDMGANVIKVERPEGDWLRTGGKHRAASGDSTHFIAINRNKRDIGLDMRHRDAMSIMQRLVSRADVVLSNYRPGVMEKLGLGYERCRNLNPAIVYCTISGFGQEGPYAQLPASDTVMQAISGIMQTIGESSGPPLRVAFPLVDISAANYAVQAILLALYAKLSGQGESGANIDVSLMSAALSLMNMGFADYLAEGKPAGRHGNQNPGLSPAGAYQVSGGRYISVAVLRESHWKKFCAALKLEQIESDEHFCNNVQRVKNRTVLDRILEPMFLSASSEYWIERLRAADILCGPLNTFEDILADSAFASRIALIDLPMQVPMKVVGTPIQFNGEFFSADRPPPAKGEHTEEILRELGFSADEIGGFFQSGSVFSAQASGC